MSGLYPNKIDLIESASVGTCPMILKGTTEASWFQQIPNKLGSVNGTELSLLFNTLCKQESVEKIRPMIQNHARTNFNANQQISETLSKLETILKNHYSNITYFSKSNSGSENVFLPTDSKDAGRFEATENLLPNFECFPQIKADSLIQKAENFRMQQNYEKAMECYAECTQVAPKKTAGYLGLAQIAYENHSNEESLLFYKKALSLEPNNSDILLRIGLIHRRAGLNAESLFWISKSLSIDPHNSSTLVALTQACLECPSPTKGIILLEKSIEISGDHPSLLLALGQLYIKTGKTEEGKALVNSALATS